jgi:hypothetical protein
MILLILIYVLLWIILYKSPINLSIVSSHYGEDLSWLGNSEWPVIVYSKNPQSQHFKGQKNVGRESTAYLKYIIDNYHNLPDYIAFIHGHEKAWHQEKDNLLDLIRTAKIDQYDFISLNFHYIDRERNEHEHGKLHIIKDRWEKNFKPFLNRECPTTIGYDCCAQFIVSKRRVLNNSLKAYEHWYNLIMDEDDNITEFVFELLWHVIFGESEYEDEALLQSKFN